MSDKELWLDEHKFILNDLYITFENLMKHPLKECFDINLNSKQIFQDFCNLIYESSLISYV